MVETTTRLEYARLEEELRQKGFIDKELIEDFYSWSNRKQKYTEEQVLSGLKWLRDNKMEPKGFGKLIKKAKGK